MAALRVCQPKKGRCREARSASFDLAGSRRSAKKSVKKYMLRSPKRKLREITLFDPRNAFPRLAPRASWSLVFPKSVTNNSSAPSCLRGDPLRSCGQAILHFPRQSTQNPVHHFSVHIWLHAKLRPPAAFCLATAGRWSQPCIQHGNQLNIPCTTSPCTSVSRKSRP